MTKNHFSLGITYTQSFKLTVTASGKKKKNWSGWGIEGLSLDSILRVKQLKDWTANKGKRWVVSSENMGLLGIKYLGRQPNDTNISTKKYSHFHHLTRQHLVLKKGPISSHFLQCHFLLT